MSRKLTYAIREALARRHKDDMFTVEVKNGPTIQGVKIMDALAMKKSWTNPCFSGYEIKVSRSDFIADVKWQAYLTMCNQFSFVCPTGLIDKNELPEHVGLLYYNPETRKLRTVRKAKYREVEISSGMLIYMLMNKVQETELDYYDSKIDFYRAKLENKNDLRYIGHALSKKTSKLLHELTERNNSLEMRLNKMTELEKGMSKIIDLLVDNRYISRWAGNSDPNAVLEALEKAIKMSMNPLIARKLEEIYKIMEEAK